MQNKDRYPLICLLVYLVFWVVLAIHPMDRFDWFLENLLVFISLPLLVGTYRKFRLSNVSYTLLTIFYLLHAVGAHYTYALVPFIGSGRNHFDRVVHFGFGFLLTYPMRELFLRIASMKGFWGYFIPVNIVLSLSALYEIVEMYTAVTVAPSAGSAFLGTQGDEWDAQKDMLLAGLGSLISMLVTMYFHIRYDNKFGKEMSASFSVKSKTPLGEVKLRKLKKSSI